MATLADEDMIGAGGIEQFCDDIGINPMDPVILVVSLKMSAASMVGRVACRFARRP
jgi:hypothetical protein